MPFKRDEYNDQWDLISRAIIKRANNKCELCYAPNHTFIIRQNNNFLHPWRVLTDFYVAENSEPEITPKPTLIILTVHHINHDKSDNSDANLIATCQKCHLRLDLWYHLRNRKAKLNAGLELIDLFKPPQ